ADETGWRVNGRSVWLWCFTTKRATYYMIHQSRGEILSNFVYRTFTSGPSGRVDYAVLISIPSSNSTPAITFGSRAEPFKERQCFSASRANLNAIVKPAVRAPEPFV
ncbi:MAG: hypothetical protein DRJ64_08250, partial [Thermoprotei archaeon]